MAFNKAKTLQEAEKLVSQGKINQAIKRYFEILDSDSSDLSLLNTIGDLYVREKNVPEGLKQFYRLAEAYVQDGFVDKASAIYKKIVKLEPDSVDPLLKLVELYQSQRKVREARDLYYQIAEFYKKKKQNDDALETLRKVVQLDGESTTVRVRLAAFCAEIGRKDEATQVYLETAQLALRRGDLAGAQVASKKLQELDPNNPQMHLLKAREALATGHPEEVDAILNAVPELKDNPAGRSLLVDSYLAMRQLEKAGKLVPEILRANPADFAPVASFVSACLQVDEFDTASRALSELTEELLRQGNTGPLVESLRLIWNKSPQHIPTLELLYRIYDERGEEYALTETLEALSQAYVQAEQFEKAEQTIQRLISREPANERHKALLKQVLKKQGKEIPQAPAAGAESSATGPTQGEASAAPADAASADAERAAAVKQALENCELFARYNLVRKAVAELDRVLEIYPDEPEIHRRLVGMCWKVMPERAEQAAQALVRVYTKKGDSEGAKRFEQMVDGREAPEPRPPQAARVPALRPPSVAPPSAQPAPAVPEEIAVASGLSPLAAQEPESAPQPGVSAAASAEATFDVSSLALPASSPTPAPPLREIDLSEDWEYFQSQATSAWLTSKSPQQATPFDYEESRIEVSFYLENGFLEEAIKAVEELEKAYPGEPRIAEFRALVDTHAAAMAAELPLRQPVESLRPDLEATVAPPAEGSLEGLEMAGISPAPMPEVQAAMPPISPGAEEIPTPDALGAARFGDFAETSLPPPPFDFEESRTEISFYLESGFLEEAMKAVGGLEKLYPGEPRIAELQALVNAHAGAVAAESPQGQPEGSLEPTFVTAPAPPGMGSVEGLGVAIGSPMPEAQVPPTPPVFRGEEEGASPPPGTGTTTNVLGDLADAFGPAIGELTGLTPPPAAPPTPAAGPATAPGAPASAPASPLGGLLEEMGEALATEPDEEKDPETHYNLGVAFREMNLLDEAIGEFQKVVKGAANNPHSPKYLQACSLLATCFMDKGMASVAVKWYCRALETPDLNEEALLALQYDLGVAYEQAGDARHALEKFTEVYGQNIDFRDVAEKIRMIQEKVP